MLVSLPKKIDIPDLIGDIKRDSSNWIKKQDAGNDKMQSIADKIAKGAIEFLKTEYKTVSVFVIGVSIILLYLGFKNEDCC